MGLMITVEDHLAAVLSGLTRLPGETVPLADAAGRTLAAPAVARVDIPVFDNSAMDGFAVHFDDVAAASPSNPLTLRVVADLPAGTAADPALAPGEAARIMTGAPMPAAADTIVPFEQTAGGLADSLTTVTVTHAPARRGLHLREQAADLRAGDHVLPAGTLLGPLQLAGAAAAGISELTVARQPRVAVISTGDELVPPGQPLSRGQIPESNGILIETLALEAGAAVSLRTSVDDDGTALHALVTRLTDPTSPERVDVVVFTGGVSAGAYEVVKTTLSGAMTFSKVAMQPGKPQGYGRTPGGTLLFGLPGNPVSAAVSFEVFVRPAILTLLGRSFLSRSRLRVPAGAAWRTPPGRRQFLPVIIDKADATTWRALPATSGGSHLPGGLAGAEAYAVIPADVEAVAAGDIVELILIGIR